jgi:pantetheine-phosphate adenylyltransferase
VTVALYPATFDPVTSGHLGVIHFAARHDIGPDGKLIVVSGTNSAKGEGLLDKDNRMGLLDLAIDPELKSRIEIVEGNAENENALFANYRPDKIIRGIRNDDDIAHEMTLARRWQQLVPEITRKEFRAEIYASPPELSWVNATLVRHVIAGTRGATLSLLPRLMPPRCAAVMQGVFATTPAARHDRVLLNCLLRVALLRLER